MRNFRRLLAQLDRCLPEASSLRLCKANLEIVEVELNELR